MGGLRYQLKSIWKDKFCIMSFFLPIIVAVVLHFAGTIDLSSVGEFHFGVVENKKSAQIISWLERYGAVTVYRTREELITAVREPSTNLIGVETGGNGIETMVAGDEFDLFRRTADTLPALYAERENAGQISATILERPDLMAGMQNIFIAMTLLVAMFMGCTFNAVSMISEKEEGIDLVNQILPMTQARYVIQKIFIGFAGGCFSAIVTAGICFRLSFCHTVLMLFVMVLSALVAALIGLLIGRFSESLMIGVVCLKIVMIIFMAAPLLSYLMGAEGLAKALFYCVPSSAALEGIMELVNSEEPMIIRELLVLAVHCLIWASLYLAISRRGRKSDL